MCIHTRIYSLWDNSWIFIGDFLVIAYFIAESFEHKGQKSRIVNTEKEFDICPLLREIVEKRIERVVNPYDICSFGLLELVDLIWAKPYDFWLFGEDNSRKISSIEVCWDVCSWGNLFISHVVLNHATSDPNLFAERNLLEFSGHFVFWFLANGAGIKDDNFSFINGIYWCKTTIFKNRFYSRSVRVVHLTSKCDNGKLHSDFSFFG